MSSFFAAVIFELTGLMRPVFIYLFLMTLIPMIFLKYGVDLDRGRKSARSMQTMMWVRKRRKHKKRLKNAGNKRTVQSSAVSTVGGAGKKLFGLFAKRGQQDITGQRKGNDGFVTSTGASEALNDANDNAASSVFRRSFGTLDASCRSEIKSATAFLHALRSCMKSDMSCFSASSFSSIFVKKASRSLNVSTLEAACCRTSCCSSNAF